MEINIYAYLLRIEDCRTYQCIPTNLASKFPSSNAAVSVGSSRPRFVGSNEPLFVGKPEANR